MHRGQFGKLRSNGVLRNLDYARVVQLGWCAFAANGDVLHRQELCVCDAPSCQQRAVDVHRTDVQRATASEIYRATPLLAASDSFLRYA